jgi:hypothetical protein
VVVLTKFPIKKEFKEDFEKGLRKDLESIESLKWKDFLK